MYPIRGHEYCLKHSRLPVHVEANLAAVKRGGTMKHLYKDLFPSELVTNDDPLEVARKLSRLAERALRSHVDPARINAAAKCYEGQLKALALAASIRAPKEGESLPIVIDSEVVQNSSTRLIIEPPDEVDPAALPERDPEMIERLQATKEVFLPPPQVELQPEEIFFAADRKPKTPAEKDWDKLHDDFNSGW